MKEELKPQASGKESKKKDKPKAASRPIGRPPEPVPQDKADQIIAWISDGKTLRDYCRQEGAPGFNTVYDWLEKDKEFAVRFARARDTGHDVIAEECLSIADDSSEDIEFTQNGPRPNSEFIQRSKLRIETRLKLLSKWNPKKYGDKISTELTGADGGPVQISDTERAAKIKALLAAASHRKGEDDSD